MIKEDKEIKYFNNLNYKLKSQYDVSLILTLLILDQSNDFEYFCKPPK